MKKLADNNMISVIIPIYNTEKYIQRCLNSVLHNSYRNIEVICINDGSTDHSLDILDEIAQSDKRVKVYS
jgi:glycosyltransferase involved in cell wall biosynthesis